MTVLNPYLGFNGKALEAMQFYQSVFGGNLVTNTFKDGGMAQTAEDEDKIMHSQLTTDSGFTLMAGDAMENDINSAIKISLSGDDENELRGYWEKLSEGATIVEPLAKAPWGDTFGMLNDKFGVAWMVNISGAVQA
jgi:PhnB protein